MASNINKNYQLKVKTQAKVFHQEPVKSVENI